MKKSGLPLLGFLLSGLVFAGKVSAAGLGASAGIIGERWYYSDDAWEDRTAVHQDFILDTRVSGASLLNYRATIGYEVSQANGNDLTLAGFETTHALGFHLMHGDDFRFWLGPQVKFSFYDYLSDDSSNRYTGKVYGSGVGPVVGVNYHFRKALTLAFSGGVRVMHYQMDYEAENNGYRSESRMDARTVGVFFDFSLLFRVREPGE